MATLLPIGPITRCRSRSGAKATKVPAPSSASGTSSCGSMTASGLVQSSSAGTRSMLRRTVSNYSPVTRPDAASMTSSSSSSGSCQNSWRSAASPTRRRQASRQTTSWPRQSLERSGGVGPWWWPAATGMPTSSHQNSLRSCSRSVPGRWHALVQRTCASATPQVPDFIALRGDPSDKIPGAKGVGPVAAANLLRKYRTLEQALLSGRFPLQAEELRLYRKLAAMDKSAPLPSLRSQKPKWSEGAKLAREWQLNRLADRLAQLSD